MRDFWGRVIMCDDARTYEVESPDLQHEKEVYIVTYDY